MTNFIRKIALALALGLAPGMALAQGVGAQPQAPAIVQPEAPAIAQPQQVSPPGVAQNKTAPADATVAKATVASLVTAQPGIGQPDGRVGLQKQFTPIGEDAAWFHDVILIPVITVISLFVLGLLLYVIVRFRRSANPVPSRTTHNTLIEVIWTLVPVLILLGIAVPSIRLLAEQYSPPKADLTVKVIGNQWYWTYQYPDNGDIEIVSNQLSEKEDKARGEPRMLGVDERMVVPAGAVVKLIVTSNDVIHSFGVPSFWVKMDAVPGRLNETWFKVDRPGLYYGQCYELCGARHGYMPIAVEVVSKPQFAAWIASKGGTMPGAARPASSDATANSPISNPGAPTVSAAGGSPAAPAPPAVVDASTKAVPDRQAATANPRVAQ